MSFQQAFIEELEKLSLKETDVPVSKLHAYVANKKPILVSVDSLPIRSGYLNRYRNDKTDKRLDSADMSYPIIIGPEGAVYDGNHRLIKAKRLGQKTILAYKLTKSDINQLEKVNKK